MKVRLARWLKHNSDSYRCGWIGIGLDCNAVFCVGKIVEKKKIQMNKMHNTSSSSNQSIRLIKVNVKNNNDNNNSNNK